MKLRASLAAVVALTLIAIVPASAAGPQFGGYVSCQPSGRVPGSTCSLAATPVAVFRAFGEKRVTYKVCVRRPSGDLKCRRKHSGRNGGRSRAVVALTRPGRYSVVWRVGGKTVARRALRVRAPRVFVDGDSLAVGTKPYLPQSLPGWPITQSTSISRQVDEGVDIMRAQGKALAGVTFMSLGTNGDPRATDTFSAAVRESVSIAGPHRCVIWATLFRPALAGTSYAGLNGILETLDRRFDNLYVVDWAAIASRNRGWFGPDGVHPTATGYEVRAAAMAEKAKACLKGPLARQG